MHMDLQDLIERETYDKNVKLGRQHLELDTNYNNYITKIQFRWVIVYVQNIFTTNLKRFSTNVEFKVCIIIAMLHI